MLSTYEILFYTAAQQRDVLGHAIMWAEHGTWTHVAILCTAHADSVPPVAYLAEAIPPAIHVLSGPAVAKAAGGAGARYNVVPTSDDAATQAWQWAVAQQGQGYSYGTIVGDFFANLLGRQVFNFTLPGSRVCSSYVAQYLVQAGDAHMYTPASLHKPSESWTPADLGEVLLGKRAPLPG